MQTEELRELLKVIVQHNDIHARWLNTLSLMENTGARKIAAGEHPLTTDISMLQHAAEEFRHAFYLKKQIAKTGQQLDNYEFENLLNPTESYHYIRKLDTHISHYLKDTYNMTGRDLIFGAYILVTYAIEVRADKLYPVYEEELRNSDSRVTVRPIIFDEQGHLEEIQKKMQSFFENWQSVAAHSEELENKLFLSWQKGLQKELSVIA